MSEPEANSALSAKGRGRAASLRSRPKHRIQNASRRGARRAIGVLGLTAMLCSLLVAVASAATNFTLVVQTSGAGGGAATATGEVASDPAGISCAKSLDGDNQGTCSTGFESGTEVTLSANPTSTSTRAVLFGGGCSSGLGAVGEAVTCTTTLSRARTVSAVFSKPAPVVLTVGTLGVGTGASLAEGSVSSTPVGITCSRAAEMDAQGDCSESYDDGTVVEVTATPTSPNTRAAVFGGCSAPLGAPGDPVSCNVTMDRSRSVTAAFSRPALLELSVTTFGTGTGGAGAAGSVTSSPSGISCDRVDGLNNQGDCAGDYDPGTVVTLTATPSSPNTRASIVGACSAPQGAISEAVSCDVTMDSAKSAFVLFSKPAPHVLTVNTLGTGTGSAGAAGTVTTEPVGVSCSRAGGINNEGDCSETFEALTVVVITATPEADTKAAMFGGGCTAPQGAVGQAVNCTVTMSQARTVFAAFNRTEPN